MADDLTRYRRISTLGLGGMARVDLAEDTLLGRPVALKRMNETADPHGVLRLRREAVTGASLSHPNLVSIYDVVTGDDGHLVLVMEYVAGETLRARLREQGRLPVGEALRVLAGVAAGLDAIHARGIVHRDVKPSNILLGADGVVKLADLGIASVPDGTRITTSGSIIGSLSYMAPEQLTDTRASPAIDIYALAAVAFETLSGQKARREANAVALAHALATQPAPDLRSAWPEAPAAAAQILSRGMARDPSVRPRSAGELVARLKAALEPEETASMPVLDPDATAPVRAREPGATAPMRARAPVARAAPASAAAAAPVDPGLAELQRARRGGPPAAAERRRRSPAGGVAAALLGLVALAAILAVVLNSGSGQPQRAASSGASGRGSGGASGRGSGGASGQGSGGASGSGGAARRSHAPSQASSGTPAHKAAASASRSAASGAASTPRPSASGSRRSGALSTSAGSGTSSTSRGAGASPASGSTTPVSAVESFYGLAAAHQYDGAWALADPSLRTQLEGLRSFAAGLAGTRSIAFNDARTVSQSGDAATVAIQTTSLRDDGSHRCTGTVDLVRAGSAASWLLHQVHINCT